jgi:DNA (cytosine-5)-methyltransferase 1
MDWHPSLVTECHKKITGSSFLAVYGRMSWDKPAPTITRQFFNYGAGRFGHPEQNRALSLREGAILQSFPKDYVFSEPDDLLSFDRIGSYIGNAVPVRLGEVIGESILRHLRSSGYDVC